MMGGCCGGLGLLGGWGWFGALLNLFLVLLFVGGVVWLIVWLVRRSGYGGRGLPTAPFQAPPPGSVDDPKVILKARYARGEITREQYLQMLNDLEGPEVPR